jgi:hypothetical protein
VVAPPFCSLSTLVSKTGEIRDVLDFKHGELLQHLLVLHSLWECDDDKSRVDAGDGVIHLGEVLDVGAQHLSWALLHDVEVDLHYGPQV